MTTKTFFAGMLALLGIIVLSSFALSNTGNFRQLLQRNPETRANLVTQMMKNRLQLSDEQVEQAYAINLRYAKLNQATFEQPDSFEPTPELATQYQLRRSKLTALLTPEQQQKADNLRKQAIKRLQFILTQLEENN